MSSDSNAPQEEQIVSLAAACDEAVAAGATPADLDGMPTTPELRLRLRRGLACAQLLRQLWPTPDPDAIAPSTPGSTSANDFPDRRLGRFQIRRELGRGGFGVVYLAYDPQLGREVALKLPRAQALLTPELRLRFAQEGRAAAGLDHPNLVTVYEAGEVGPVCYIASAYCPGITLAAWLKQRAEPAPFAEAAALVTALADAVQHAHSRGVLHRDLKPANVLLHTQDESQRSSESPSVLGPSPFIPKITDFGLAKLLEGEGAGADLGDPTQTGAVLGTPSYMAPEQSAGKRGTIGPEVDVYALGAILYEVLTGRPPFHGETPLDTLEQARTQEPLPPSRLRPRLPQDVETICLKCLEKEPGKRYARAGDLAGDLRRYLAGEPIRARPVRAWHRTVKWAKRRPAAAVLLAVCVLLATVGFPGVTWLWLENRAALASEAKERRRAEASGAATLIALAHRDWLSNDVGQARTHLNECPPEYRDERWQYLQRACHAERISLSGLAGPGNLLQALAWSPDSKRLAIPRQGNTITLHDVTTGEVLLTLSGHRYFVYHLAFNSTGDRLTSVAQELVVLLASRQRINTEIKWWDVVTGNELGSVPLVGVPRDSALMADGRLAVPASKGVTILDGYSGRELLHFGPLDAPIGLAGGMAFSNDGRFLATTEPGGAAKVWDVAGGKLLQTHNLRFKTICRPAFRPDGQRVAWALSDQERNLHSVQVWDWSESQALLTLAGHTARVNAVAFHPDGRHLASGSSDRTVVIWDTVTGREVLTLRGHTGNVLRLAFSPNGRSLASADEDGTMKVWETSSLGARP